MLSLELADFRADVSRGTAPAEKLGEHFGKRDGMGIKIARQVSQFIALTPRFPQLIGAE